MKRSPSEMHFNSLAGRLVALGALTVFPPGIDSTAPLLPPVPLHVAQVSQERGGAEWSVAQRGNSHEESTSEARMLQAWCPIELAVPITSNHLSSRFDPTRHLTEVYVGDYHNNRIVRHDFDSNLVQATVPLPVAYGDPWLVEDLDRDGEFELIVQRGDPGFGGNGYLDILQSPTWDLRQRLTFPGKKGYMFPRALNLDSDPYLEVFLTLNDGFGGPCQAAVIDYSPFGGFYVRNLISVPVATGGPAAIADFDLDGRMEFISGASEGYTLLEWRDTTLVYIGLIDSTYGNNNGASACHPKPEATTYALIGHSSSQIHFRYELLRATGDNQFEKAYTFQDTTGLWGISPSGTNDADCDGLDELAMMFFPTYREYGWDEINSTFVEGCAWVNDSLDGSLNDWHGIDFDRNGTPEWAAISGQPSLYAFAQTRCANCDPMGRCQIPRPCVCDCHGDPICDGTRSDVVDVVKTIGVAFRGESTPDDGNCPIARADFDCSGTTDVLDVVKVINVAFRSAEIATEYCHPCTQ